MATRFLPLSTLHSTGGVTGHLISIFIHMLKVKISWARGTIYFSFHFILSYMLYHLKLIMNSSFARLSPLGGGVPLITFNNRQPLISRLDHWIT